MGLGVPKPNPNSGAHRGCHEASQRSRGGLGRLRPARIHSGRAAIHAAARSLSAARLPPLTILTMTILAVAPRGALARFGVGSAPPAQAPLRLGAKGEVRVRVRDRIRVRVRVRVRVRLEDGDGVR